MIQRQLSHVGCLKRVGLGRCVVPPARQLPVTVESEGDLIKGEVEAIRELIREGRVIDSLDDEKVLPHEGLGGHCVEDVSAGSCRESDLSNLLSLLRLLVLNHYLQSVLLLVRRSDV